MVSKRNSKLFAILVIAIITGLLFQNFSGYPAGKMAEINMEDGTYIESRYLINNKTRNYEWRPVIVQVNPFYREFESVMGEGTEYKVAKSNNFYSPKQMTGTSLGFIVEADSRNSNSPDKPKSKIEIIVSKYDDMWEDDFNNRLILKNSESIPKYLGFSFFLDPNYQTPANWVIHMQALQCCLGRPPLTFQVLADENNPYGNPKFIVLKRNDDHINVTEGLKGEVLKFWDGSDHLVLERGKWHRIVFRLQPDPGTKIDNKMVSSTGKITMYLNGVRILNHQGAWGYTRNNNDDGTGTPWFPFRHNFSVKVGAYRALPNTMQKFYFDNIRWATSYCGADPTPDITNADCTLPTIPTNNPPPK